jgi:hypothetical protein
MVSVAALALIAGTGMANAQGMGKESGGATGGASTQHSSPADTSAGSSRSESTGAAKSESSEKGEMKGGMKSSQSEQKQPGAMKNERAEDNVKGGSTSQRAEDRAKGSETKGADSKRADDNMKNGRDNNMKAEGRDNNARDNNMKAEGKDKSGTNAAENNRTNERTQATTGQAGAGAKLSTEQRTKISTVIKSQHVESVNNVNFSVSVGTRVPRDGVRFSTLPAEVVTIYPQWRGYDYIVVHDRIVIIDPQTYEIVEIIES